MKPLNCIKSSPALTPVWFYGAAWAVAVCAGIFYFAYVTADPDLWGHIRFGEDTWLAGTLHNTDPYSFTASGMPWINHEWLTELFFYGVYRAAGDGGLLVAKLIIGLAVIGFIGATCRFRLQHPVVFTAVILPGVIAMAPGFMIRPQLFSYLLFSIYLFCIHLYFHRKHTRLLYCLPVLMMVWVNLHGGFLIGLVLLGIIVGWQTITALINREKDTGLKKLWIVLTGVALATLVNPYGYRLHLFLYHSLKSDRPIGEWDPVSLLDGSFLSFKILAIVFIAKILMARRQSRGWETVTGLFMLYVAIRHQRHIPFFAIAVSPYLIYLGSCLVSAATQRVSGPPHGTPFKTIIAVAFYLVAACFAVAGFDRYMSAQWRIIVNPDSYPSGAVRFMRQNNFTGNLILPFEWGEYAIWKLYPACRVSIDGRFRTVYPETVIQAHFTMFQNENQLAALVDNYPADILLARQLPWMNAFIRASTPQWLYVYSDRVAIIFIRNSLRNRQLIEAFKNGELIVSKKAPSPFFP